MASSTTFNNGYLKESEFIGHAPSSPGEQVHVNHDGCSAGVDTKRRLYVKRNEDHSVVAYCQHCGKRGISGKRRVTFGYQSGQYAGSVLASPFRPPSQDAHDRGNRRGSGESGSSAGAARNLSLPRDATTEARDWPVEARNWINQFGLSAEVLSKTKGWAYTPKYNRVLIPVWDTDSGGLLGYQSRRLTDNKLEPKYLTFRDKAKDVQRLYYRAQANTASNLDKDVLVLVEDALSAEKVSMFYDACAILTVTADAVLRDKIILGGNYKKVVVWLDDDNTDVKSKQMQLCRMLDPYVKVHVMHTGKDPKRHSRQEIRDGIAKASF